MNRNFVVFGTGLVLLILLGTFFFLSQNKADDASTEPTTVPAVNNESNPIEPNQTTVPKDVTINSKKLAANYFVFEKSEYEKAKAANRPVLLFFYANWCPTCARQEPINVATFNNLGPTNLIIFRVNYNDSDTSSDEESLAKEFGVTYQHQFYLLDSSGKQIDFFQGDTSESELKEKIAQIN